MGATNRRGAGLGQAEVPDLPGADELLDGAGHVLDGHGWIYTVLIEQVNDVRAQTSQGAGLGWYPVDPLFRHSPLWAVRRELVGCCASAVLRPLARSLG